MNPQKRKVRVVLKDGERTANFAWLCHTGRAVLCGVPDGAWHMVLPEDGRAHYTVLTEGAGPTHRYLRERPIPLETFKGQRALLVLDFASRALADAELRPFNESKARDAVAFLNLRAFPDVGTIRTELGIVEAWKADQLQFKFDFEVQQLLLVTGVRPWVYIAAGVRREAAT